MSVKASVCMYACVCWRAVSQHVSMYLTVCVCELHMGHVSVCKHVLCDVYGTVCDCFHVSVPVHGERVCGVPLPALLLTYLGPLREKRGSEPGVQQPHPTRAQGPVVMVLGGGQRGRRMGPARSCWGRGRAASVGRPQSLSLGALLPFFPPQWPREAKVSFPLPLNQKGSQKDELVHNEK